MFLPAVVQSLLALQPTQDPAVLHTGRAGSVVQFALVLHSTHLVLTQYWLLGHSLSVRHPTSHSALVLLQI